MQPAAPQIGFDRFLRLEWIGFALMARIDGRSFGDLDAMLADAGLAREARAKTLTKLRALWLQPREDLADFGSRGVEIARTSEGLSLAALGWGMAITTYPFFGKTAELIGRLTAIQGDCSSAEVHRRMSELYGERAVTKRAAQAVIQTIVDWGGLTRDQNGKRLSRSRQTPILNEALSAWLVEAALRYNGRALQVVRLQSLPVLFPFDLRPSLGPLLARSPDLMLRSEGPDSQLVDLRRQS